jgi:hypothetical protein
VAPDPRRTEKLEVAAERAEKEKERRGAAAGWEGQAMCRNQDA